MRLACVVLSMLVLLGCQAPADGAQSASVSISPTVTATAPADVVDSQEPVATGLTSVWGEVPKQCA